MHNCIMLAGKQRVDADPRLLGQFLEAVAHQFVGDENFALLLRKLVECIVKRLKQNAARIDSIGTGVRGGKQFVKQELFAFLVELRRLRDARLTGLSAKQIRDAVARYPEQPRRHLLYRLHHPVGFDQFEEDILKNVLGVAFVGDTLCAEAEFSATIFGNAENNNDNPSDSAD